MDNIQTVLSALDVFSTTVDKSSLDNANSWLQEFQHSTEAWSTSNVLLMSAEAPQAAKLFAAQTFRSKVMHDLGQVDPSNLAHLQQTLLSALRQHQAGPRSLIVQLSLALIGLALQYTQWEAPVQDMINTFGKDPVTVPALLQFLTLLPEELMNATRYPLTDDDITAREEALLSANAAQVMELLSMYLQAPGVTSEIQEQVFYCLRSWLLAGEVDVSALAASPLFAYMFEALASDQLFDAAVGTICDLIHETQEIEVNMGVIEMIVPRVIALRPRLTADQDDVEKMRGYARIFNQAGTTYIKLVVAHNEAFFPIVEAIGECSAYHDLDVVPITFEFWMNLASFFKRNRDVPPVFINAYQTLVGVMIKHLHFPSDDSPLSGQDADDFRSFRHVMGDTLKDCCVVLGTDTCLMLAYNIISQGLSRPAATWQEVEAPLFALRSMGGEVKPNQDGAVLKIMDIIPALPEHPRVRYAALMIISRYTEWIDKHPQFLPFLLEYISKGFESTDYEVSGAAGQALKYVCQDCRKHLTDFLPTLHVFLNSPAGKGLHPLDQGLVYEAIAFVISAMPMASAAESLRLFAMDIFGKLHEVTNATAVSKEEMKSACVGLENLEFMLTIIRSFGEDLPPACQNSIAQTWSIFDAFLTKYGSDYEVAERVTRVLRCGITFYGQNARPMALAVVTKLMQLYEAHRFSSYLWICGKAIDEYGYGADDALKVLTMNIYQRSTQIVVQTLHDKEAMKIPDVLEDYVHLAKVIMDRIPDVFFTAPTFEHCFKACVPILGLSFQISEFALDVFRDILADAADSQLVHLPQRPLVRAAFQQSGLDLLKAVLVGLIGDYWAEEKTSTVVSIVRSSLQMFPNEVIEALPTVLQDVSNAKAPVQSKNQFVVDMTKIATAGEFDKVRYAVYTLRRSTRKARDRRGDLR
ncbi:ARM repeat-containing protein [Cylindrobasidium torrendii FP15055 ss-10]|uniref:ARM repeat-containing protein n=1 Tax=Cylindrobasidium torrendii FP15055 ss-10 TaxID=1314674 RepID=A0A0D7BKK5_9AGAR|nr:ARM repeat-containing protein [Cylindrobasidium torrendii FP15055 ss-10]